MGTAFRFADRRIPKMIRLFDYLTEQSRILIDSLDKASIPGPNLLINYDGLSYGKEILTPFLYFSENKTPKKKRPLFFDEIPVPEYWEIRHVDPNYSVILDGDKERGKVHYFPLSFRHIKTVDWTDEKGTIYRRDHYSDQGVNYAYSVFQESGKKEQVYYIDEKKRVKVILDKISKTILLPEKNQAFEGIVPFVFYFIQELIRKNTISPTTKMLINSLSTPLLVSNLGNFETTLFWQERITKDVPGNMVNQIQNKRSVEKIIFEDKEQQNIVQSRYPDTHVKYSYLSPLFVYHREHRYSLNALITTKTDEIFYLENILKDFPSIKITVAAPTKMSDKLKKLSQYPNITLLEAVNDEKYEELFLENDIYLNINSGTQVNDSLCRAYLNKMIILSLGKTRKDFHFAGIVAETNDYQTIREKLMLINMNQLMEQKVWTESMTARGPESVPEDYQQMFK
jgi:accessory Sec system glycosyltransferase GtfB